MDAVKDPDNTMDLISQWIESYEKDLLRVAAPCFRYVP